MDLKQGHDGSRTTLIPLRPDALQPFPGIALAGKETLAPHPHATRRLFAGRRPVVMSNSGHMTFIRCFPCACTYGRSLLGLTSLAAQRRVVPHGRAAT